MNAKYPWSNEPVNGMLLSMPTNILIQMLKAGAIPIGCTEEEVVSYLIKIGACKIKKV